MLSNRGPAKIEQMTSLTPTSNSSLISATAKQHEGPGEQTRAQHRDLTGTPRHIEFVGVGILVDIFIFHSLQHEVVRLKDQGSSSASPLRLRWMRGEQVEIATLGRRVKAPRQKPSGGLGSLCRKAWPRHPPLCPISISSNAMPSGPPVAAPGLWGLPSG